MVAKFQGERVTLKRLNQFLKQRPYSIAICFTLIAVAFIIWYTNHYPIDLLAFLISGVVAICALLLFLISFIFLFQSKYHQNSDTSTLNDNLEKNSDEKYAQIQNALKEAQTQLIEQEKMASIGMLTAGIAHEIKNPLNFINNFSEMTVEMLAELKTELAKIPGKTEEMTLSLESIIEDIATNCKKINEHGKRAESIIKNMLLQSRSAESEKMPSDVNALLEEYLNLAYHGMRAQNNKFNAKIEKNLDSTITNITLSPQGIGRVFLNIIHNGLYAANEKWDLLSTQPTKTTFMPTLSVSSVQNKDSIIVTIKDNGNGIPDSLREKIFEPFFTTKPPGLGTGLGLPICYDIVVKAHNGKLEINSSPGEFTEFIITLPKVSA